MSKDPDGFDDLDSPEISESSEVPAESESSEFIRLADYVSKEHKKCQTEEDPSVKLKIIHIERYRNIQTKRFEGSEQQKGIQINKAA